MSFKLSSRVCLAVCVVGALLLVMVADKVTRRQGPASPRAHPFVLVRGVWQQSHVGPRRNLNTSIVGHLTFDTMTTTRNLGKGYLFTAQL